MFQPDEKMIVSLLRRLQQEALTQQSSITILQKSLQLALEATGWEFAAASKLSSDQLQVELLSFVGVDHVYANSAYDLLGTPCQSVFSHQDAVCYLDMQQRFLDEIAIRKLKIESYAGMMYYIAGKPVGHIYFMSKQVCSDELVEKAKLVLQLLSVFIGSRVELIEQHKELVQQRKNATIDVLTGIYNRRRFEQDIERVAKQYQSNILADAVLVMLDIDGLKVVNDTYGHSAGDEVIQFVSSVLLENFRKEDSVYRLGGDEFAVLILGNAEYMRCHIQSIVERIRQKLVACDYPNVSISAGEGLLSQAQFDTTEWINRTDKQLYCDKQRKQQRMKARL